LAAGAAFAGLAPRFDRGGDNVTLRNSSAKICFANNSRYRTFRIGCDDPNLSDVLSPRRASEDEQFVARNQTIVAADGKFDVIRAGINA
jgi:hypothetical protein